MLFDHNIHLALSVKGFMINVINYTLYITFIIYYAI